MVYNRIAYDEANRKIGQNPRESWRMVPDSHPAIISWELFDEVSALREAEQAVREERKTWCKQRRKNNPNIFKGRIFCKECGKKLVCHWQRDGSLYFYCKFCHVSISEKDRKSIAITPCAAEHPMSFKVPDKLLTDGQCRMMINGIQFIQVLLEANGLAAGKDHQFKGRYDAEKNAVIISLEKDEQSALSPQKCTT